MFCGPGSPPPPPVQSEWYVFHGKCPPDGCGRLVKPACCLCRVCEARRVPRNSGLLQVGAGELDYAETHTGECQDANETISD